METITVYHYTNKKFEKFDNSKSDGLWFTDIKPGDLDMLKEIGANGMNVCAKCEITFENEYVNGGNFDVEEFLAENESDCIVNMYDGFTDYAICDESKVKIIEWINM